MIPCALRFLSWILIWVDVIFLAPIKVRIILTSVRSLMTVRQKLHVQMEAAENVSLHHDRWQLEQSMWGHAMLSLSLAYIVPHHQQVVISALLCMCPRVTALSMQRYPGWYLLWHPTHCLCPLIQIEKCPEFLDVLTDGHPQFKRLQCVEYDTDSSPWRPYLLAESDNIA
jgi:hypothetical protein